MIHSFLNERSGTRQVPTPPAWVNMSKRSPQTSKKSESSATRSKRQADRRDIWTFLEKKLLHATLLTQTIFKVQSFPIFMKATRGSTEWHHATSLCRVGVTAL